MEKPIFSDEAYRLAMVSATLSHHQSGENADLSVEDAVDWATEVLAQCEYFLDEERSKEKGE